MSQKTLRIAVIALIVFGAALVSYGGFTYIVREKMRAAAAESAARAQATSREIELLTLKKLLEDSAEDRARLRELIISEDGLTEFLELVEATGRGQGLDTKILSVNIAKPEGQFEQLKVTTESVGGYVATKRFIELIETLPYEVDMQSASLVREDTTWTSTITFSVTKGRQL